MANKPSNMDSERVWCEVCKGAGYSSPPSDPFVIPPLCPNCSGVGIITRAPPSAPAGEPEGDALSRALGGAYAHGERRAPFAFADCARQIREALAQQPVEVDRALAERFARVWCAETTTTKFEDLPEAGKTRCVDDFLLVLTKVFGKDDAVTQQPAPSASQAYAHKFAAPQPPAEAQPVGEAGALPGSNGGFTTAVFKASDVPVGTKLYAHPPPSAPVGVEGTPIRYFAYDRDDIGYNEFDTLAEAVASAQESLDYAGDDGWPPGGPSICYGVVLGEAREVEGSRRPAKPGDHPDADFIVEYELSGPAALAQQPAAQPEAVDEEMAMTDPPPPPSSRGPKDNGKDQGRRPSCVGKAGRW